MAYTNRNKLERIADIQEIVKREQAKGIILKRIYRDFIKPKYHIAYSTYNNYLGIPAKNQLKKLNEKDNECRG